MATDNYWDSVKDKIFQTEDIAKMAMNYGGNMEIIIKRLRELHEGGKLAVSPSDVHTLTGVYPFIYAAGRLLDELKVGDKEIPEKVKENESVGKSYNLYGCFMLRTVESIYRVFLDTGVCILEFDSKPSLFPLMFSLKNRTKRKLEKVVDRVIPRNEAFARLFAMFMDVSNYHKNTTRVASFTDAFKVPEDYYPVGCIERFTDTPDVYLCLNPFVHVRNYWAESIGLENKDTFVSIFFQKLWGYVLKDLGEVAQTNYIYDYMAKLNLITVPYNRDWEDLKGQEIDMADGSTAMANDIIINNYVVGRLGKDYEMAEMMLVIMSTMGTSVSSDYHSAFTFIDRDLLEKSFLKFEEAKREHNKGNFKEDATFFIMAEVLKDYGKLINESRYNKFDTEFVKKNIEFMGMNFKVQRN